MINLVSFYRPEHKQTFRTAHCQCFYMYMMNEKGHSSSKSRERYFWRISLIWKVGKGVIFSRLFKVVNLSSGETSRPTFPANHFSAFPENTDYRGMKDEHKVIYSHTSCYGGTAIAWSTQEYLFLFFWAKCPPLLISVRFVIPWMDFEKRWIHITPTYISII